VEPVYVDSSCAVVDDSGVCVCKALNPDGSCARPIIGWVGGRPVYGLGADEEKASVAPWIAGGILLALAVGAYALDKKGPAPLRSS
jgi:hypothetical protein